MRPELKADTKFNWRYRTEPYVTIRRPLHPEVRRPVSLAGVSVKDAPVTTTTTALALAMKAGYALIKSSPLLAAIFPHPITYGMVAINGVDALVYANGTAAKLEAFAMLGGGLQGAAAAFNYVGNNQLRATYGNDTALIDCGSHDAFRSQEVTFNAMSQKNESHVCNLDTTGTLVSGPKDIAFIPPNTPALPIPISDLSGVCHTARTSYCKPPIKFDSIGNNQLLATAKAGGTATFDCQADKAFTLYDTLGSLGVNRPTCNLKENGKIDSHPFQSVANITALPISDGNPETGGTDATYQVICEGAADLCERTYPTPTPTPTPTPVRISNVTFTTPPPSVTTAIPPGFTVSNIGLALGLTGAGIVLATMGGGALTYFLYLHNKKDGTVRVQEIHANKVAITMDRLKVPDEVRVKFEEVAIAQLPLV